MEIAVYYAINVIVCSVLGGIMYRIGYKSGAKKVLNEWKDWLNDGYNDHCLHGNDWDDCPDCRH